MELNINNYLPLISKCKASHFDIAQTSGRPLPTLFNNIEGDVKGFERFFQAVKDISPVPIGFEQLTDSDGYYHQTEKRIALREGMSERQTAAAVIHEVSHATLHALDMEHLQESLKELGKDHRTMEVEAESIAYVVCQHYGIETGENSFGYIAMWSKDRSLPELQASLKVIRDTASDIIGKIDERIRELELAEEMEKENTLLTGSENMYPVHEKSNDLGERNLNTAHKSVGSDEQPAVQIKDKPINERPSREKARHKRQSKRKAR